MTLSFRIVSRAAVAAGAAASALAHPFLPERVATHFDASGEPDRYSYFQTFVRTGTLERYLFVWFGRKHPTQHQLARANAELRTAR